MSYIQNLYSSCSFFEWVYQKSVLSGFLHKIKQYYYYFHYKRLKQKQRKETEKRLNGWIDERYIRLKEYKDKYKGKRCFITCTGPSLTIADLEMLKNEYVFGMNSICLIHDKTNWKPDFYGIQDSNVFNKIEKTLLSTDNGLVFAPYYYREKCGTPESWVYFPISSAYHLYDRYFKGKFHSKFSDDCYATVYDGFTITYSIMQLAIYMGFDEIYLLGADCNYLGNHQHFIETGHYNPEWDAKTAPDRLVASYSEAKKYADAHGIKMFNATRGGCLELFPRVTLEDVLKINRKNKSAE